MTAIWSLWNVPFMVMPMVEKPYKLLTWIILEFVLRVWAIVLDDLCRDAIANMSNYVIVYLVLVYATTLIGDYCQTKIRTIKSEFVMSVQKKFLALSLDRILSIEWQQYIDLTKKNLSNKMNSGYTAVEFLSHQQLIN